MPNRKKDASERPSCQRKRGNPTVKTLRGVAELYEHKKRKFNATLTPEAIQILEKIANLIGESRSQVIEKAMRGEIDILQLLKVLKQEEADTEKIQEAGALKLILLLKVAARIKLSLDA